MKNTHGGTSKLGDGSDLLADHSANSSGASHGHERYQVFHFDFDHVQAAYVVSLWIFIASIAKIGRWTVTDPVQTGFRVMDC